MKGTQKDIMGMVFELDDGGIGIDPSLIEGMILCRVNRKEYLLGNVPGVSSRGFPGMDVSYHQPRKGSNIPEMFIRCKRVYRIRSRDDYTNESIIEPVEDLAEATRVINSAKRNSLKPLECYLFPTDI